MTQDANPMRMKSFNYINIPSFFESVFNFFKTFLNEKIKSRVSLSLALLSSFLRKRVLSLQLHVHADNASLYKEIPQELLPVEYGGKNGTIDDLIQYWEKKIIEYRDFLIEDGKLGTDEAKRRTPSKHADALFGVEGSFRKLDVD